MPLVLHGYRYSVYVRIVRLALAEKGVAYDRVEVNPFAPDVPASYLALHPFGRVPTLVHDDFALYETGAITRYVDRAFAGPGPAARRAAGAGADGPDHRHRRFLRLLADGAAGLLASACSGRASASRPTRPRSRAACRPRPRCWRRSSRWSRDGPGRHAGRPASRRDDRLLRAGARRSQRCCSSIRGSPRGGRDCRRGRASPRPIPACRCHMKS